MQQKLAVVFDSAGTLLQMHRVAKNTITGEYKDEIITTDLVGRKPDCGLVIVHTDPGKIINCNASTRIYDFIQKNNIKIDVSCSSSPISVKEVEESIRNDSFTTMQDIHDVINIIKIKCPDIFYLGVGIIVDVDSRSIKYTICTGGRPFTNTRAALDSLKDSGVDTYIASGDSMRNLENLAGLVNIPVERVYDVATPRKKEWVINNLKKQYDKVVMVGDAINDILAFRASDKSILSIQQTGTYSERLFSEADVVIQDILQIVPIVQEMQNQ